MPSERTKARAAAMQASNQAEKTQPAQASAQTNSRPSFKAELAAIGREAVKDIRGKVHEVFFNSTEGMGEPGTPYNPTPQIITEGLKGQGVDPKTDQIKSKTVDNTAGVSAPTPEVNVQSVQPHNPQNQRERGLDR